MHQRSTDGVVAGYTRTEGFIPPAHIESTPSTMCCSIDSELPGSATPLLVLIVTNVGATDYAKWTGWTVAVSVF